MTVTAAAGQGAARQIIGAIGRWQAAQLGVLVIAIDGHGGAGKSTIAAAVADATGATLVHTDDFFQRLPAHPASPAVSASPAVRPGSTALAPTPPAKTAGHQPPGGPALAQYYDWRRIRAQALDPLRAGNRATFRQFDWERGRGLNGSVTVEPTALIVLEGVLSAAPELSDLVDRSVLVHTPEPERLQRLRARLTPEEWDPHWLIAEQAYFGGIRPPSSFDLIVSGMSIKPA